MKIYITSALIAGFLVGCSDKVTNVETNTPVATANAESMCPDDGPRLPLTGICTGRAVNYLNIVGGDAPLILPDCHWEINETRVVTEVLLYMAATCEGKKAQLGFAGGSRFADLNLVWSAVANASLEETVLIKITSADMQSPHNNILFNTQDALDNKTEAAKCSVRSAGVDGWPEDALVVDVSADEAAKAPKDEPRTACGPFGLNQDETAFWRVFQGFSWWFQYSQDAYQDIDPRSLTLIEPDGNGGWNTVE